jgi:hypothetical protein
MPGALVEVVTDTPREAREALLRLDGVRSVLIVGDGVHVHVDDIARQTALEQALRSAGVRYDEVQPVTPTIEDLFVALLGMDASSQ